MDLIRVSHKIAATSKEYVKSVLHDDPLFNKWEKWFTDKKYKWLASQLKAGVDPSELSRTFYDFSILFPNYGGLEKYPYEMADFDELVESVKRMEAKKEDTRRTQSEEEILGKLEPYKEAFKKAWNFKPKNSLHGGTTEEITSAVAKGRKPVGDVRRYFRGDGVHESELSPRMKEFLETNGLEYLDKFHSGFGIFIFKPENRDIAEMVRDIFSANKPSLPGQVWEYVFSIGYGYGIPETNMYVYGKNETPPWVLSLLEM